MTPRTAKQENRTAPSAQLAAVLSHPLRCRIASFLSARVASPVEMAYELREPLSDVSYHTSVLAKAAAIEEVSRRSVRGATEHYYTGVQRNEVTDEDYAAMPHESRQDFDRGALQFLVAEAGAALDAGTMTDRPDHCIARIPGEVDQEGWDRLNAIFKRAMKDIQETLGESTNRFAEDKLLDRIPVASLLTFFELPAPTRCSLPEQDRRAF